jgi:hypothetical protein
MATSPASNFTACSSGLNNITAYGAGSYTWTGPTGTFYTNSITANAVGCYTVVGSNGSGCGNNTQQVCVNAISTTPTISITGTNSTYCPNTPVTFSASGAPILNWSAYTNNSYYNSNNASSIVITPTTSGALCVTVTANNGGCIASSSFCGSVTATSGTLNVTGQNSMCSGSTVSLTASGAQTYTWSTGSNASSINVSPNSSTCFTVSGTNACNVILTGVRCVSVFATPTVNIVGNNTVCIGGSSTFTATGSAATYTWISLPSYTGVSTGTTFVAYQNTNCFAVYAFNGYCTAISNTVCITAVAGPTVSITSNTNSICPGTNVTLSALGSTNYTWNTGAQGSNVVVNPTASTCYTASSSANGCTGSAVMCVNVINGVQNGGTIASSVCAGSSLLLSTGGANTYVWNTSATTSTILVNPTSSQCYTATGFNTAGCSGSTIYCVNVLPAPSLTISGSNTVCLGSSVLLTASGAGVFNWSTGPTSNTISLIPSASTVVTVSSPNGNCPGFASYTVTVDTTCSNVWPGDANSDGLVSTADLLEIGLAASSTGASRSPGGNAFTSQFANNWTGTVSSGKNKCHADCNGDGTVNSSDTLAIYNNITLTHAFRPAAPATDPDLPLTSPQSYAFANAWNRVDITIGSNAMPSVSLLGVGFELTFDNSLVVPDSIYLVYNGSVLNANSSNYTLRKCDFNTGRIFAASVRTNQQDANVSGNIASLYFKVTGLAGEEDHIVIKAENVNTLNQSKQRNNLQGGEIDLPVSRSVGMKEYQLQNAFSVAPNPAKNNLIIRSENKDLRHYRMIDVTGRIVMSGSFTNTQTLNVTELQAGVYFIEVEGSTGLARKKVIIEN